MQITVCMAAPSSFKTHQPWIVGCRMEQYHPPALHASSSVLHGQANLTLPTLDMTKERIRKLFRNVEFSVSPYDTAWVAMVPCPKFPKSPRFPECLNWLMDNQRNDGSWDLLHHDPRLLKDSLSSTLACIIALKRWNLGEYQIKKGLHFIESNFASATDKSQPSPFGFEIIFPGMLEYAKDLDLELPLQQTDLRLMLHERKLQLKRCDSKDTEAYLAYISEGLGNLTDWNTVMKYQMENGSLFNSPSATAAAVIHHQNDGCLGYLISLLEKFGNAVPTVYPIDLYGRLCMVDTLESLGIARHFKAEIQNVLNDTYRRWMERDEQIFMDTVTCALAFRLLRINGYEVSSEFIHKEVDDALKFSYNANLERISTKTNIENYNANNTRLLKTVFRSPNIGNKDYLRLAVEDFNSCQSICREELKGLERWVVEFRLDKLKFARQKTAYCYFSAASTLSFPELSDARISWGKSSILTTVVDDFFDVGGSMNELVNLIQCVEKWDVNVDDDCCSEAVGILFLALKDAIGWIGDKALKSQGRDVTSHVIQIWLALMRSMLREAIWVRDNTTPTINEYMENGYVSFALGPIVLPALYFISPNLPEEIVESSEYHKLYELMSTYGRLCNDIRGFKREYEAGKLNAVALHMNHGKRGKEEVVEEMKAAIGRHREELMKLVLETKAKGSVVPRACKDVFWNMCNVLKLFYATDDGFTGNAILDIVKEIIYEPVSHRLLPPVDETHGYP